MYSRIAQQALSFAAAASVAAAAAILCVVTIEFLSALIAAAPRDTNGLRLTMRAFVSVYVFFFGFGVTALIAAPIYWGRVKAGRPRSAAIETGLVLAGAQTVWMFLTLDTL